MTAMAGEASNPDASRSNEWRNGGRGYWRKGACGQNFGGHAFGFRPLELIAIILGFVVFWPLGLALLVWRGFQRKFGPGGGGPAFAAGFGQGPAMWRGMHRNGYYASSGNVVFDEWKASELKRLEEERQKLAESQREFAEYLNHLRQAKDRGEFDRFRNERDAAKARGETGWRPFDDGQATKPQ